VRPGAGVETAAVPERPWLSPWYRLAWNDDRLVLSCGHSAVVLEGRAVQHLLPALLPLLDGTRTVAEVVACIGEPVEPAVEKCLALLTQHGLLTAGPPFAASLPRPLAEAASFFAAVAGASLSPAEALDRITSARVGVAGEGPAAAAAARALLRAGVGSVVRVPWEPDGTEWAGLDLLLAAPGGAELPQLEALNRAAIEVGAVWMTLLPFDGRMAAIGPLFVPGETACYLCYRLRRAANLGYADDFLLLERVPARYPVPPFDEEILASLGTRVAVGWLVGHDPSVAGAFYAYEQGETLALGRHAVYRVPRCPACSPSATQASPLPWHRALA
jgi:bacteriocin biosynthesis cyclodehydratase domain-containing protein